MGPLLPPATAAAATAAANANATQTRPSPAPTPGDAGTVSSTTSTTPGPENTTSANSAPNPFAGLSGFNNVNRDTFNEFMATMVRCLVLFGSLFCCSNLCFPIFSYLHWLRITLQHHRISSLLKKGTVLS